MNNQNLEKARTAIESILNTLKVARVVYVDDVNDKSISMEDIIACAQGLEKDSLLNVFPELASIPDDQDVLATKIREVWAQLDAAVQVKRGHAVILAAHRHDDGREPSDENYASILSELIPNDKLDSLSPAQWEEQKEQLLQDSKNQSTLFLFDQDFTRTGGGSKEGINIIKLLLAKENTESLICGLLTHTITPEEQPQQWIYLSEEYGIPRDRFLVIPKLHLSDDPILFAQILKLTALSPNFSELKCKTKEIIKKAIDAAEKRVDDVSIYDLNHIVLQEPAKEGLWEPDMLFRLHAMFHRLESCRLAHEGGELETIAAKLRVVSGIPAESALLSAFSSAWKLQHEELYESGDYINKNYLPLELGDIFEKTTGNSVKKYILLAQPCDLMVRSSGERSPELCRVPLAEIVLPDKTPDKTPYYWEEMPYFDTSPDKKWYVKFKYVHFVRAYLLDLCVLNQDGEAKLTVDEKAPSGIRPAWKKRYNFLSSYWRKEIHKADVLAPETRDQGAVRQYKEKIKDFRDRLFDDELFKGRLIGTGDGRSITYNCKRIERLSRTRALGLLMSYTATLARPAYDLTFGQHPSSATCTNTI